MLIVQLSDPHVRPHGELYQGVVDSNAMLAAAVVHVNRLDPQPDLVLLSGDLVDHGDEAEYEALLDLLAPLRPAVLAIPGNHDDREAFRRAFAHAPWLPTAGPINYVADAHGPVRIVALDVTLPGLHHGAVDDAGLQWLEQVLSHDSERPAVIMMHHPPFGCGVPYLDAYLCHGGTALADVISRHPAVERVVCGHVHRFMQLRFGGTVLCTAPSTTTAIALQLSAGAAPASHVEPPAMLLHHWRPGIGLITHFVPVGVFPGPYPFA